MRDDDVYDEDEVRHLLQTGSESEHENMSTEMGYDADSEETNFDETDKGTYRVYPQGFEMWVPETPIYGVKSLIVRFRGLLI